MRAYSKAWLYAAPLLALNFLCLYFLGVLWGFAAFVCLMTVFGLVRSSRPRAQGATWLVAGAVVVTAGVVLIEILGGWWSALGWALIVLALPLMARAFWWRLVYD